ncbi:uncharacterized protein LOC131035897 isoform X2 [Cryptomeria japonica]|uniref:uncharacterized protein LOC131035897 isoform X2 n=1 Tax=Cryptomeria japonica TaxID=3369 RepID=UPI0025AC31C1|nr:uncharacterized protein LOC131035897 isoform X2 [Cryptomeria japonica]
MARSEEGKRRDDGRDSDNDNDERKSSKKRRQKKSPVDSDSSADDNRKRKERRERKEKKHKRSKKDKVKTRHRDDHDDTDSDEQHSRVKKGGHKHKHRHHRRKSDHSHDQKKGLKRGIEEVLSAEDYFLKNIEFSTWLKKERGIFFSSLSSESSHMLFLEFVIAWNSGELHSDYYEGMSTAPRTDHNWGLKGVKKTLTEDSIDPVEEREIAKKIEKSERKKFQKMQEVALDELLPKATGRERLLEKKSLNREKARAREDSPEPIKEKDLLGGGDDFHARLDRERARRQKKVMERSAVFQEKLQASRQKEAAALSQLQAIVNDAGGKITIPKRT